MQTDYLSPNQIALARHHSYSLFGRLYLEGITDDLLPFIQVIPELASVLRDPFDSDEAAANHHQLFGFNIFPYAAIFLDSDGLLGGQPTNAVQNTYHQMGYQLDVSATSPDHIGHELGLLAFLSQAEAEAWEDDQIAAAHQRRDWQREFLQTHLLRWLLPFIVAVQQHDDPFYATLAELTLGLIHEQYIDLVEGSPSPHVPFSLASAPALLSEEKTGLREIANFLITPVYSGFYLSRHQIGQLANQLQLPCGFGSRQQMLLNVFRSAVAYASLPTLCTTLEAMLIDWQAVYQDYAVKSPNLDAFAGTWFRQAGHTIELLAEIKQRTGTEIQT